MKRSLEFSEKRRAKHSREPTNSARIWRRTVHICFSGVKCSDHCDIQAQSLSSCKVLTKTVQFCFCCLFQLLLSIPVPYLTVLGGNAGHWSRTLRGICHSCLVPMSFAAASISWRCCWTLKVTLNSFSPKGTKSAVAKHGVKKSQGLSGLKHDWQWTTFWF